MKTQTSTYNISWHFNTWHEFIQQAANDSDNEVIAAGHNPNSHRIRHYEGGPIEGTEYWSGHATWEEALDQATHGWQAGAAYLKQSLKELHVTSREPVLERGFSPVGPGNLAMGRYIDGHPAPWTIWKETDEMVESHTDQGIVHIAINISQSHNVLAEQRFRAGAMILSLIDLLEQANRRVELTLLFGFMRIDKRFSTGRNSLLCDVTIKHADSPVNLPILAYALANIGTYRRFGFSLAEQTDATTRKYFDINSTYSSPAFRATIPDAVNIRGVGLDNFKNQEERNAWLKNMLADQGVEWEPER